MPQVPVDNSPSVAPIALPGARVDSIASADDFGGIQAKQTSDLSSGAEQVGAVVQAKQDTDVVNRATAQLKQDVLDYQATARQRTGVNAWNLTKDTTQWFNDQGAKYRDSLDNEDQRNTFLQTFMSIRSATVGDASLQEATQRTRSLEDSSKATIVGTVNYAASNYSNPGVVPDAIDTVTKQTQQTAQLNGWTPERTSVEQMNATTNLHTQVLQNMVKTDPEQAQRYFDTYKDQIGGDSLDRIEKLINGGKFTVAAQQFADGVQASNLNESDAIAAARQKFSGPEQEQVVLEVKTRYQEKSKAREDMQRDAADAAYKAYAQTGRLSSIAPDVWNGLDGKVQLALRQEAEAKAKGEAVKTDPGTFYNLRTMASQDPDTFSNIDLRAYKGRLSEPSFEQFVDMQQSVKKPAGQKDVATLDQQLGDAHNSLGWRASDEVKKGTFDQSVLSEIDSETKANGGKPLNYAARQSIIDRYSMRSSGFMGFGSKLYSDVAGTPAASNFTPNVPDKDKAQITAALIKRGQPTDAASILRVYKQANGLPP